MTAIEQFEAAISDHTGRGRSRLQATRAVVTERPDLHAAFLAQVNHREHTPPAISDGGTASASWDAAIKAETDSGASMIKATRRVVRQRPDLHASYISEATAAARRR